MEIHSNRRSKEDVTKLGKNIWDSFSPLYLVRLKK